MPKSSPLLAALLLLGCGHPRPDVVTEPEPEDSVSLAFGWSPDVRLAVSERRTMTQEADGREGEAPEQTVRFVLQTTREGEGYRVSHRGMWVDDIPPQMQRVVGQLDVILPSYNLDERGRLDSVELAEEVPEALAGDEAAERLALLLRADAPEPWIRYQWHARAGIWVDREMAMGVTQTVEIEGAAGRAELTFVEPTACPGPTSVPDTRCVKLELSQRWETEPDPLTMAISRSAEAQGVEFEGAESRLEIELIVEEATLVPHRERRVHTLSAQITPPDGEPTAMRFTRNSELDYRIVHSPESLGADSGMSDQELVSSRWDAYDTAVMARDGQTAAALVTAETLALYAEARQAALEADREALGELSSTRRLNALLLRHAVEAERLQELDGAGLFAMAIDEGWTGGSTGMRIVDVSIEDDEAVASVLAQGQEIPIGIFRRQDEVWKLDLVPMVDASSELLEQAAQQLEMEEDDFMLHLLEQTTGEVPAETIWDPPTAPEADDA